MKKVVVASFLACAVSVPALRSASAQQPVNLGSGGAAAQPCQMPDAEYKPYNDAISQTHSYGHSSQPCSSLLYLHPLPPLSSSLHSCMIWNKSI